MEQSFGMLALNVFLIIGGVIVIILNVASLLRLRDKYVSKEDLELCKTAMEEACGKISVKEFQKHCRKCKEELSMDAKMFTTELNNIKEMLAYGDDKFTFIELLLLEFRDKLKLDIPNEKVDALRKIAMNRRK